MALGSGGGRRRSGRAHRACLRLRRADCGAAGARARHRGRGGVVQLPRERTARCHLRSGVDAGRDPGAAPARPRTSRAGPARPGPGRGRRGPRVPGGRAGQPAATGRRGRVGPGGGAARARAGPGRLAGAGAEARRGPGPGWPGGDPRHGRPAVPAYRQRPGPVRAADGPRRPARVPAAALWPARAAPGLRPGVRRVRTPGHRARTHPGPEARHGGRGGNGHHQRLPHHR